MIHLGVVEGDFTFDNTNNHFRLLIVVITAKVVYDRD